MFEHVWGESRTWRQLDGSRPPGVGAGGATSVYTRRLLFERGSGSDRELCLRFPPQMPQVARSEPAPKPELEKQSCARGDWNPGTQALLLSPQQEAGVTEPGAASTILVWDTGILAPRLTTLSVYFDFVLPELQKYTITENSNSLGVYYRRHQKYGS